ncbi:hypothetical protein CcaverHIS002_0706030 [Cutaneotrichosporon cavernicola]|nr:hypothetical protein CcaverHIS002_0706030 [Cutaneotrichosporon cavernicola]
MSDVVKSGKKPVEGATDKAKPKKKIDKASSAKKDLGDKPEAVKSKADPKQVLDKASTVKKGVGDTVKKGVGDKADPSKAASKDATKKAPVDAGKAKASKSSQALDKASTVKKDVGDKASTVKKDVGDKASTVKKDFDDKTSASKAASKDATKKAPVDAGKAKASKSSPADLESGTAKGKDMAEKVKSKAPKAPVDPTDAVKDATKPAKKALDKSKSAKPPATPSVDPKDASKSDKSKAKSAVKTKSAKQSGAATPMDSAAMPAKPIEAKAEESIPKDADMPTSKPDAAGVKAKGAKTPKPDAAGVKAKGVKNPNPGAEGVKTPKPDAAGVKAKGVKNPNPGAEGVKAKGIKTPNPGAEGVKAKGAKQSGTATPMGTDSAAMPAKPTEANAEESLPKDADESLPKDADESLPKDADESLPKPDAASPDDVKKSAEELNPELNSGEEASEDDEVSEDNESDGEEVKEASEASDAEADEGIEVDAVSGKDEEKADSGEEETASEAGDDTSEAAEDESDAVDVEDVKNKEEVEEASGAEEPEAEVEKLSEAEGEELSDAEAEDLSDAEAEEDAEGVEAESDAEAVEAESDAEAAEAESDADAEAEDLSDAEAEEDAEGVEAESDAEAVEAESDAEAAEAESDADAEAEDLSASEAEELSDAEAEDLSDAEAEEDAEAAEAESDAEAVEAESDAEAVEAESDAEAAEAESDAEAVEAESDAEAVEADSDAEAVEAESDAEAVEAESDAEEAEEDAEAPEDAAPGVPDGAAAESRADDESADDTVSNASAADDAASDETQPTAHDEVDLSRLKDGKVNKGGNVVVDGKVVGRIKEGVLSKLVGKIVDENGDIWNDSGKKIGAAELIPDDELEAMDKESAPFEAFPDAVVDGKGYIVSDGERIGKVAEGDTKKLRGMHVDADGDILDRSGNVIGRAERWEEEEPEPEAEPEEPDLSRLKNGKVNKSGNVVVDGKVVGRIKEGVLSKLVGKAVDENGVIWNDSGKKIGVAELIPDDELEAMDKESAPFEAFPDAVVDRKGYVVSDGERVGKVAEGDPKKLRGMHVDADGDILDRSGNVIGRAERWEEEEPEPEAEPEAPDLSRLKNGKVNKGGNVVVDGKAVGRIKEGVLSKLVGRSVDENGVIWSDSGKKIGAAELIPDDELNSMNKEPAPFEAFPDAIVDRKGYVVSDGERVGKVAEGDPKKLRGMHVDADGDILDRAGNAIGRAERWEEEEPEPEPEPEAPDLSSLAGKRVNKAGNIVDSSGSIFGRVVDGNPKRMVGRMCDKNGNILSESGDVIGKAELVYEGGREGEKSGPFTGLVGCKVNKNGKVLSPTGDVVGKLVQGDAKQLAGREVDDDGDICDKNGNVVGHAEREDVEEEDPKVVEERDQAEKDKKLAKQLAYCIQQTLDQVKPICEKISRKIEAAENTPKDQLDEKKLVAQVRPLIEEGGRLLSEANGTIRGMDPDGRIQQNAKYKAATHEATPEEYHLAEVLKELTGTVAKTIDDAKRKLEGMPRAQKKLNPLWRLLSQPLGQILAGVGLLLSGVLGIVGNLLNGLGLGGLVNGLLGGLGIDKVLEGLGLGKIGETVSGLTDTVSGLTDTVTDTVSGVTGGGKEGKGGLLGGIL